MTEAFERYKEALKAGHVALLRNRLDEALGRYRLAAEIADHRALPHVSIGEVLLRMRRVDEALAAFATALGRDPADESALEGRARALVEAGRRGEAADAFERLAEIQAAHDRPADALATLRRALDLSDTARRRRREAELAGAASPRPEVAPEPPRRAPLAEGDALLEEAERAIAAGDRDAALTGWLAAASRYIAEARTDAALDACQRAIGVAPGSAATHLTLAAIYLERGWRDRGTEKLLLLDRLLTLDDDEAPRTELAALAGRYGGADGPLATIAAGARAGATSGTA